MAITFSNIGLAEPSTVTNRVAAVTIARGSTNEEQEILVLGDPESSLALARVLAGTPASTEYGLAVREIAQSTGPFVMSSLGGVVAVQQNSTVWAVQLSNYSTTANVSSLAGRVLVDQNSTVWPVQVSAVAGTVATAEVLPTDSTFASGSKASSGDTTLLSSAASQRIHVFGYVFTVDSTTPTTIRLLSGSTTEMARWLFRAPSSISVGANQAVSMPAYLYRTAASAGLVLNTDSTATVHYAVQAYRV